MDLAQKKTWAEQVLGRLGFTEADLDFMVQNTTETDFRLIVAYLFQTNQPGGRPQAFRDFLAAAEKSVYPKSEWLAALAVMIRHCEKNRITSQLPTLSGYLACVCVSPEEKHLQVRLPKLVEFFLEQYGFENRLE